MGGGQEEEANAELLATIQHDHVAMKTWYNTNANNSDKLKALHEKYGSTYPSFWRDVVGWDGWKETRRVYLAHTQGGSTDVGTTSSSSGTTQRKRKSRWASATTTTTPATDQTAGGEAPKRKSRWARGRDETPKPVASADAALTAALSLPAGAIPNVHANPNPSTTVLDLLPGLPNNLNTDQQGELQELQKQLREANEKLKNLEVEAARVDALPHGHADRSPSPPPVYGADGKRKNTRAVRWKERYTTLRQDTLERILSLTSNTHNNAYNPNSIAPSLFKRKRNRKIYIPVEQHPTYNFIGLIIGPRGKTQKEMENKTGCKIAIRGKGSVKEGARGRRDGKMMDGDDDPLHVVITGDHQASVDAAADMVQQMLVVIDDDKNVHKQQQLRELALLNGTLKDEEYCQICAEKGHRSFECPKRFSLNRSAAGITVKCAICGDTSHPTRDCVQKPKDGTNANGENGGPEKDEKQLDSDYLNFMAELDGKPAPAAATTAADTNVVSAVTTILSSTDPAAVGVCTLAKDTTTPAPTTSSSSTMGSVITTISTRVIKNTDATTSTTALPPPTTAIATPAVTTIPPAPASLPPPPLGGPPAPAVPTPSSSTVTPIPATAPTATGSSAVVPPPPPPPLPTAGLTLPPPPSVPPQSGLPPPPPAATAAASTYQQPYGQAQSYYPQQQQQQQQPQVYGNQFQAAYPSQYPPQQPGYNTNGVAGAYGTPQQPNGPGTNGNPASGTWDYTSYYGTEATGGDAAGAGGFNWWESS